MRYVHIGVLVALVVGGAACGGGEGGPRPDASAEPTTKNLTVRVVADQSGFGCTQSTERSGTDVGSGGRLTVKDEAGDVVGTGTFDLSPGLEFGVDICDWTAVAAEVDDSAEFYSLESGGELATVSASELGASGWRVTLYIGVDGTVQIQ